MHYYKRNLGDYAKKAGRLSMLQHGSYTLLIDACYDREQFPTRDEAIDWTWASSTAEIEAVDFVLAKFFVLEDGFYIQTRIREELAEYQAKATKNQRIAIDRETKRKENSTERARNVNEAPPNHKPLTINQEPKDKSCAALAPPDGVSPTVWDDFLKIRKAKKSPVTKTAIDGIEREAVRAGVTLETALATCCEAGWQGFNAVWYAERQASAGQKSTEPGWRKDARERMQSIVPSIAEKSPGAIPAHKFFETEANNVTALRLR